MTADVPTPRRACPICGRPATLERKPFCSTRCAEIDLHRWFSGQYSVPGAPADDAEESDAP